MSGHSKWSQIKHRKALTDQKKGRLFSRLAREITIAARGNPDPKSNYRLKAIIDKARSFNMPLDNIERAITRVSDKSAAQLEEIHVEALGPGGVVIIIVAITDNRNRTINDLRTLLSKLGVRMVHEGSLLWMFKKMGVIRIPENTRWEDLELAAIEAGAQDVVEENNMLTVYTAPEDLSRIEQSLGSFGSFETTIELIPSSKVNLSPSEIEHLTKILEIIDAQADIQEIFTNST